MQNFIDLKAIAENADLEKIERDYYAGNLKESDILRLLMLAQLGKNVLKGLE